MFWDKRSWDNCPRPVAFDHRHDAGRARAVRKSKCEERRVIVKNAKVTLFSRKASSHVTLWGAWGITTEYDYA